MSWKISIDTSHDHDIYNYIEIKDSHHTFTVYLAKEEDSIGDVIDLNHGDTFERNDSGGYINSSISFNCFFTDDELLMANKGASSSNHGFIPCPHCGLVPPKEFMKFVKNPLLLKMGNKL